MAKVTKKSAAVKANKNKVVKKSVSKLPNVKKTLKSKVKTKVVKSTKIKNEVKKLEAVTLNKLKVDYAQIKQGVKALMKYCTLKKSKDLTTVERPIYLQIAPIKIPRGPTKRIRILLKHSLLTDTSEACLITADLERGRRVDHDPTIEHYTELLNSHGITQINRVIPFRQIKVEYDQFELKRRLAGFFNGFLVDSRISGHLSHKLGSLFYKKLPVPVRLSDKNLKATIDRALRKTLLTVNKGSSYTVQIGHTEMKAEEVAANLRVVIKCLARKFPGGWDNIRVLHIRSHKTVAIPVYLTLKNPNLVMCPVIKVKLPKTHEVVQDELSTYNNHEVMVRPSGSVKLVCKNLKYRGAKNTSKSGRHNKRVSKNNGRKN